MRVKELRTVLDAARIQERVTALGAEIDACYGTEALVAVCVLKGASVFFADLVRAIRNPHVQLDFIRLSSYGTSAESSKNIVFSKDVELPLVGKHVLLIEDIIDTGHTLEFVLQQFAARGAASVRIAALVDKKERREVSVQADFVGFSLQEGFLVGYGLDYAEQYRTLPAIYEVIPE